MKPQRNEYEVSPNATVRDFLKAGFVERGAFYSFETNLVENIKLSLKIDKEDGFITTHVLTPDGTEFAAFWVDIWNDNNELANQCIIAYNNFMDSLIIQGVLQYSHPELSGKDIPIRIKYASKDLKRLEYIDGKSDWIDLRCAEDAVMKAGEYRLLSLGVAMQLPQGYEALCAPRSSTFKNFGIIQANSLGIIDNSYNGDEDWWRFPAYAVRDTEIHFNDRICQFRIIENQPHVAFYEKKHLGNANRGGIGSTGIK